MTEKISLRKFNLKDLDIIMELFIDKDVIKGTGLNKKPSEITRKFEMDWLKKTIKNYRIKKPESYNLAILLEGKHIGNIGSHKIDYENDSIRVGYWIGKKYWGKGYTTKALKLFLKEIKRKFNPVRIYAYHYTRNPASGRVMEKCGFKCEGTLRKNRKVGNKYLDSKLYAIVR